MLRCRYFHMCSSSSGRTGGEFYRHFRGPSPTFFCAHPAYRVACTAAGGQVSLRISRCEVGYSSNWKQLEATKKDFARQTGCRQPSPAAHCPQPRRHRSQSPTETWPPMPPSCPPAMPVRRRSDPAARRRYAGQRPASPTADTECPSDHLQGAWQCRGACLQGVPPGLLQQPVG